METFDMRPRTVGEVLDGAIKLYIEHARTLIGIVACVVVPMQIVSALVLLSVVRTGSQVPGNVFSFHLSTVHTQGYSQTTAHSGSADTAALLVIQIVASLMAALATAACVRAVSDIYADRPAAIGSSLVAAARRLPALVALYIVRAVGLIIAFILLIIPGIWLYGSWSVSTPALLIEDHGPFGALRRSAGLVRHRWWPVAGVILLTEVLAGLATYALHALFAGLDGFSSHPALFAAVLATTLSSIVAYVLVQPFSATVTTVLYYDLRVRQEGYDLHVLADQLGLPTPDPFSGADFGSGWRPGEPLGPDAVGRPGGPPFWPPPPGWQPPDPEPGG